MILAKQQTLTAQPEHLSPDYLRLNEKIKTLDKEHKELVREVGFVNGMKIDQYRINQGKTVIEDLRKICRFGDTNPPAKYICQYALKSFERLWCSL